MDSRTGELQSKIKSLADELREHAAVTDDKQCAALCETSAEALSGIEKAFSHFLNKSESAWK